MDPMRKGHAIVGLMNEGLNSRASWLIFSINRLYNKDVSYISKGMLSKVTDWMWHRKNTVTVKYDLIQSYLRKYIPLAGFFKKRGRIRK